MDSNLKFKGKLHGIKLEPVSDSLINLLLKEGIIITCPWKFSKNPNPHEIFGFPLIRNSVLYIYSDELLDEVVLQVNEYVKFAGEYRYEEIRNDILFNLNSYLDLSDQISYLKEKHKEFYYESRTDYFLFSNIIDKPKQDVLDTMGYELSEDWTLINSYLCHDFSQKIESYQNFSWIFAHENASVDQLIDNTAKSLLLPFIVEKINELEYSKSINKSQGKPKKRPKGDNRSLKELFDDSKKYNQIIENFTSGKIIKEGKNGYVILPQESDLSLTPLRFACAIGLFLHLKGYLKSGTEDVDIYTALNLLFGTSIVRGNYNGFKKEYENQSSKARDYFRPLSAVVDILSK